MKFDILQRAPAMEAAIARTTNKRHLAILENYRRHAILEVCGLYEGILAPDMIVPNPVYRFHTPKGTRVIEGMEAVRAEYQSYVDQNTTVIYHTQEHCAVDDDGLYTEYVSHRFFPGKVLLAMGDSIDDPDATYMATLTQSMFWPYDEEARLVEERVYRGNDRKLHRCEPDEVITMQECRDKLMPLLRPVAKVR
ncbi:hypothetical protein [Ramlibacter sp.]|uniref:hypothetical protein n=1 Tax=Ramlibacter sp. TaxID=1917967 RepID=UPI003D0A5AC3